MGTFTTMWEDEEYNRVVELRIRYQGSGDALSIVQVAPVGVTFLDAATREPLRTLSVYTRGGRRLLWNRVEQFVSVGQLREELLSSLAVAL